MTYLLTTRQTVFHIVALTSTIKGAFANNPLWMILGLLWLIYAKLDAHFSN